MKKIILFLGISAVLMSCSGSAATVATVGESKQKVIKTLGTPVRTLDNSKDGEILVYADQVFLNNHSDSQMAGEHYWRYNYIYVNKEGKVTSSRQEKQNYPPQAIDSVKLLGMNLLTSK